MNNKYLFCLFILWQKISTGNHLKIVRPFYASWVLSICQWVELLWKWLYRTLRTTHIRIWWMYAVNSIKYLVSRVRRMPMLSIRSKKKILFIASHRIRHLSCLEQRNCLFISSSILNTYYYYYLCFQRSKIETDGRSLAHTYIQTPPQMRIKQHILDFNSCLSSYFFLSSFCILHSIQLKKRETHIWLQNYWSVKLLFRLLLLSFYTSIYVDCFVSLLLLVHIDLFVLLVLNCAVLHRSFHVWVLFLFFHIKMQTIPMVNIYAFFFFDF